jgi:hypothetical protein
MTTRREFLAQSAAAGLLVATSSESAENSALSPSTQKSVGAASVPKHPRIKSLMRRDETILRLGGCGGAMGLTWAADDRQFVSMIDTAGFSEDPKKIFHSRLYTASGTPPNPVFEDVPAYPDFLAKSPDDPTGPASYWAGSTLALDGSVYQLLITSNVPYMKPDGNFYPGFDMTAGVKLIYSPDNGRTWHNQDGSSPATAEKWDERSRENMLIFNEGTTFGGLAFGGLTFLQMGRNYELNKDGYVYAYTSFGKGRTNELIVCRIPKARILDRLSYEFFSGMLSDGSAAWTRDSTARAVVHTFPRKEVNGRVLAGELPDGWDVSVTYNGPIGAYVMVAKGMGSTPERGWFSKPSYLGFWSAPTPWGPFSQFHEESAWTPGNDSAARAFSPIIAPKWISADGKSFWLVWADYQYKGDRGQTENPDADVVPKLIGIHDEHEAARFYLDWMRRHLRYFRFNAQRVDLVIA